MSCQHLWQRYCEYLKDFSAEPGPYQSNRFKDKIDKHLEGRVEFVKPLDSHEPLLVFPPISKSDALQELLTAVHED